MLFFSKIIIIEVKLSSIDHCDVRYLGDGYRNDGMSDTVRHNFMVENTDLLPMN